MDRIVATLAQFSAITLSTSEVIRFRYSEPLEKFLRRLPYHLTTQLVITFPGIQIPTHLLRYLHAFLFMTIDNHELITQLPGSEYQITHRDMELTHQAIREELRWHIGHPILETNRIQFPLILPPNTRVTGQYSQLIDLLSTFTPHQLTFTNLAIPWIVECFTEDFPLILPHHSLGNDKLITMLNQMPIMTRFKGQWTSKISRIMLLFDPGEPSAEYVDFLMQFTRNVQHMGMRLAANYIILNDSYRLYKFLWREELINNVILSQFHSAPLLPELQQIVSQYLVSDKYLQRFAERTNLTQPHQVFEQYIRFLQEQL